MIGSPSGATTVVAAGSAEVLETSWFANCTVFAATSGSVSAPGNAQITVRVQPAIGYGLLSEVRFSAASMPDTAMRPPSASAAVTSCQRATGHAPVQVIGRSSPSTLLAVPETTSWTESTDPGAAASPASQVSPAQATLAPSGILTDLVASSGLSSRIVQFVRSKIRAPGTNGSLHCMVWVATMVPPNGPSMVTGAPGV